MPSRIIGGRTQRRNISSRVHGNARIAVKRYDSLLTNNRFLPSIPGGVQQVLASRGEGLYAAGVVHEVTYLLVWHKL